MSNEFRVLSWNIDGLCEVEQLERFVAATAHILSTSADVVMLQEVISLHLAAINRYLSFAYTVHLPPRTRRGPYFVAILLKKSSFPGMKSIRIIPFPGSVMGRGLLVVDTMYKSSPIRLGTTHLESGYTMATERISQAQQSMEEMQRGYGAFIFAGDLNIRETEVTKVSQRPSITLTDAWEICGSSKSTKYTWETVKNANVRSGEPLAQGKRGSKFRFDRMWFSENKGMLPVAFQLVGELTIPKSRMYPSDHYGILCTFNLDSDKFVTAETQKFTPRPAIHPLDNQTENSSKRPRPNIEIVNPWPCKVCTFINEGPLLSGCSMCGTVTDAKAEEFIDVSSDEEIQVLGEVWYCAACTYENINDDVNCGICATPR